MASSRKPSQVRAADEEVQSMCDEVKGIVEEKTSNAFSQFKAASYRTLVDYINSRIIVFIKVQISDSDYLHLRIFRLLPSDHGEVTFEQLLDRKKDSDLLETFEATATEA